jgi:hypothetical protein
MITSQEAVLAAIGELLRSQPVEGSDDSYTFEFSDIRLAPITPEVISAIVDTVKSFDELDECSVVTRTSFEVLIQTGPRSFRFLRNDLNLEDAHSGLSYKLGAPSDAYLAYLCLKLTETDRRNLRFLRMGPSSIFRDRLASQSDAPSVFDLLRVLLRIYTLTIKSETPRSKANWKHYADGFYFHVAYNLDAPLMPDRYLSELIRPARISSTRRSRLADLDVPRRHYVSDLVYHYQLGVSSESPMLEYISYYHVAEHWFENIYQDDLVEQIQSTITSPSFSYKRKKDLRELIRKISRAVQLRDDQLVINEQVALRLTLTRYLDVGQLAADLQNFDPSLPDYYANNVVSFCGGNTVSFDQIEESAIITSLASRIYKTRNALVHSKEGSKGKFVPFTDDRDLMPEVPLMRFIAEQIITATSDIPG